MTEIGTTPVNHSTAQTQARANWRANLRALTETQPRVASGLNAMPAGPWVFGRDGFLTARPDGAWLGGRSVPLAAARQALCDANVPGTAACFALPGHAAEVQAALDRLARRQAAIAIVADTDHLAWMLACADFAVDLRAGRLFFVPGLDWQSALTDLLTDYPGLPTPSHFLRTPWADQSALTGVMEAAQRIFADANQRRARWLADRATTLEQDVASSEDVCVYAPTGFRLWDDGGWMLRHVVGGALGGRARLCDGDRPPDSSPPALARAAEGCAALVTANLARADAGSLFPSRRPWVTWITDGRIPRPILGAARDRLLLADPTWRGAAQKAGWAPEAMLEASWPTVVAGPIDPAAPPALIVDLPDLQAPPAVREMSSRRLLWEAVYAELTEDPFVLPDDVERYLRQRMRPMEIAPQALDLAWWIGAIVVPSYQVGLARRLARARIPLQIWGAGWDQVPDVAARVAGPVGSRELWLAAIERSGALIHAWPTWAGHPVTRAGRAVIRPRHRGADAFLRAVAANDPQTADPAPRPLSAQSLIAAIAR